MINTKTLKYLIWLTSILLLLFTGCSHALQEHEELLPDRLAAIPEDAVKLTPEEDLYPPILHSGEWEDPIPMPGPINSAGVEDSPFITPDGKDFYFFFTPDAGKGAEMQVTDGVTGIYWSSKHGDNWNTPERVLLQEKDKLSLDGCIFVQGDIMWFCSVREGNQRQLDLYTASLANGQWTDWKNAGKLLNSEYGIGELHITSSGSEMYFHADKKGGFGGLDIWVSRNEAGTWQPPINISSVNTPENEGWPFISEDEDELWITRTYKGSPALFRSTRDNTGDWSRPELIISRFAGEAALDKEGNIYFTHPFYKDSVMLEADIYTACRK